VHNGAVATVSVGGLSLAAASPGLWGRSSALVSI
jgi:hypothetical protein